MLDWYLRGGRPQLERENDVISGRPGAQTIPLNVFENEEGITVVAPMPGIETDDLEISVLGDEDPGEGRGCFWLQESVHLPR